MHTYSMRGCQRERYIFYISMAAIAAMALANHLAGWLGIAVSVGSFTLFGILFFVFDRFVWRLPIVSRVVGIPDLAGRWRVSGETDGADGQARTWQAEARIEQTWTNIAISLETKHSRSRSAMATLEQDVGHGFRVVYGYENEPKATDGVLRSHRGTCLLVFNADLSSAEATYFNDHQRRTCGEMKWQRIVT